MITLNDPRPEAHRLADPFAGVLLHAKSLARQVIMGEHGRRDTGAGEEFWQYRPYETYLDGMNAIDWRRSAKSDDLFVRQYEHKVSQTLMIWVDHADRMQSVPARDQSKSYHAAVVAMATTILADHMGEKIGHLSEPDKLGRGESALARIASRLSDQGDAVLHPSVPKSVTLLVSDFLGDMNEITNFVAQASDAGQYGVLLQVTEPREHAFPFKGRTVFQDISGRQTHKAEVAQDIRQAYLARFAERRDQLVDIARRAQWGLVDHVTSDPMLGCLQKLHVYLGRRGTR